MIEFFKIQGTELLINREEVLFIKEFADILNRQKSQVEKLRELLYVKYMAESILDRSIYAAYPIKERGIRIKENIGIPKDWEEDKVIKEAIEVYKTIQIESVPSARILNALERGLYLSANGINSHVDQMEKAIELSENLLAKTEELTIDSLSDLSSINGLIQDNMSKILSVAEKLPKTLISIKQLTSAVKKEVGQSKALKGGGELYNREDPATLK